MKTREQILEKIKNGKKSECFDGRDFFRLVKFFQVENWVHFGLSLKEEAEIPIIKEWTKENIIEQLRQDIDFGFEKALDKRGISSSLMYDVVKMWMWVLDDPLQDHNEYAMYGLPLFKKVAVKYGFNNPIGNNTGNEEKYND